MFSPDGRYVAYLSDETGQMEVYVRPLSGPGAKRPVSTDGAGDLMWGLTARCFTDVAATMP